MIEIFTPAPAPIQTVFIRTQSIGHVPKKNGQFPWLTITICTTTVFVGCYLSHLKKQKEIQAGLQREIHALSIKHKRQRLVAAIYRERLNHINEE